jgi:hypothetical protein
MWVLNSLWHSRFSDTSHAFQAWASRPELTWTSYAREVERTQFFVGGAIAPTTGEFQVSPDTFVRWFFPCDTHTTLSASLERR